MNLTILATSLASLCYLLSAALLVKQFFSISTKLTKIAFASVFIGIACHFIALLAKAQALVDHQQLSLSFVATILAWLIVSVLLFTHKLTKNYLFLPLACVVAAVFLVIDQFLPTTTGLSVTMSVSMLTHIMLSLLAFGVLTISLFYALQVLYINYQLKHKNRILLAGKLPPLMAVENLLYRLMSIGIVLLLAALLSGFLFVPNMMADGYAHKTLLTSLGLTCYVIGIALHYSVGVKIRVTVIINIVGLTLLSLGYFGSRLVREVILS